GPPGTAGGRWGRDAPTAEASSARPRSRRPGVIRSAPFSARTRARPASRAGAPGSTERTSAWTGSAGRTPPARRTRDRRPPDPPPAARQVRSVATGSPRAPRIPRALDAPSVAAARHVGCSSAAPDPTPALREGGGGRGGLEGLGVTSPLQRQRGALVHRFALGLPAGAGRPHLHMFLQVSAAQGLPEQNGSGGRTADVAGAQGQNAKVRHLPIVPTPGTA